MDVILGILVILYLGSVCFPAFMFIYERGNGLDNLGCGGFLVVMFGFPGFILGCIVRIIREHLEAEERKKNLALADEWKKQAEIIKKQKMQAGIEKYTNSHLMPTIISHITQYGTPNKICIYCSFIHVYYTGGESEFNFLKNGINNLHYDGDLPNEPNTTYMLACAINQTLGNIYQINGRPFGGNYAELIRPLQDF